MPVYWIKPFGFTRPERVSLDLDWMHFKKLYIVDDSIESELAQPFDVLLSEEVRAEAAAIARAEPEPMHGTPEYDDTLKERVLEGVRPG